MYREINPFQRKKAAIIDLLQRRSLKYAKYRFQWHLARKYAILPSKPLNIDVELSDACNLRCSMCVHGMDGLPNVGHMDDALAVRLINEAAQIGVPAIKFNWRGEPGLHPRLIDYIKLAKKLGFVDIQINTNLVSLNSEKTRELALSGIHRIIVSCDGATKDTYESIRIGSSFERLRRNLEIISNLKKEHNMIYPKVRIQFVKQISNVHEVDLFFSEFKHLADDLRVSEVSNRGADGVLSVGDQIAVGRRRCEQPWQRIIISKDGIYHPCCNDWDQTYPLGNTKHDSIMSAWNSQPSKSLRQSNLLAELDSHPLCKNCFVPESYIWQDVSDKKASDEEVNAFGRRRAT